MRPPRFPVYCSVVKPSDGITRTRAWISLGTTPLVAWVPGVDRDAALALLESDLAEALASVQRFRKGE